MRIEVRQRHLFISD